MRWVKKYQSREMIESMLLINPSTQNKSNFKLFLIEIGFLGRVVKDIKEI